MTKREFLIEYAKCLKSPSYAIKRFLSTVDLTSGGYVPFELFDQQERLIDSCIKHKNTIVRKSRQVGCTTVIAAYIAYLCVFAREESPEMIYVMCNQLVTAKKILAQIKEFVGQFPAEFCQGYTNGKNGIYQENSTTRFKLTNKSFCQALAANSSSRGNTCTLLLLDELAFFEGEPEEIMKGATMMGSSENARSIYLSTPNGLDAMYYKTYQNALNKQNSFNIVELRWEYDPRYNKGLEWRKRDGDNNTIETINETNFNDSHLRSMIESGYEAWSPWFQTMCQKMNNNKRSIASELQLKFLGSGGNVINVDILMKHEREFVTDPIIKKFVNDSLWIWSEPQEGRKYIMPCDVAGGDGEDYSTFHIIDVESFEQMAEFKAKVSEVELAELLFEIGTMYNAYIVVDKTGGMGKLTINKLIEAEYPHLHYEQDIFDETSTNNQHDLKKKNEDIGFVITTKNRHGITTKIQECVEQYLFKIKSQRLIEELKTWIWIRKGGVVRADHQRSFSDDLIMALGIGLYVIEYSFKKIEKAKNSNKAMLEAMLALNGKKGSQLQRNNTNSPFGHVPQSFTAHPVMGNFNTFNPNGIYNPQNPRFTSTQDPTGQYDWARPSSNILLWFDNNQQKKEGGKK